MKKRNSILDGATKPASSKKAEPVSSSTGEPKLVANLTAMLMGLREGIGLTMACELTGNSPREVSSMIREDAAFKKQCTDAVMAAGVELLTKAGDNIGKGKIKEAAEHKAELRSIRQLVLWGDYRPEGQDMTITLFMSAFLAVKDPKEVATALGLTFPEYVDYVLSNKQLKDMVALYTKDTLL